MLNQITYYPIFGKPLIMYLGILTIFFFSMAAYFGIQLHKGKPLLKWKIRIVVTAFTLGLIHGILGVLAFF